MRVDPERPTWRDRRAFACDLLAAGVECGLSTSGALVLCGWYFHEIGPTEQRLAAGVTGYNLAGVKAREYEPHYLSPTFEYVRGRRVVVDARWRAYASLAEACAHTLHLLDQPKFLSARSALRAGDPAFYALLVEGPARMGSAGWYTAPVADYYRAGCRRLYEVSQLLSAPAPIEARVTDVRERQAILRDRAQYSGAVDGVAGPATRAAIERWQRALAAGLGIRLVVDGVWGDATSAATCAIFRTEQ